MIYLASDYAGFRLKENVKKHLAGKKVPYTDLGCHSDKVQNDFPEFAKKVALKVKKSKKDLGILVCGTGQGMSIAANRFRGVRAVLVYSVRQARLAKTHDDANILCLSGMMTKPGLAQSIVSTWLVTTYTPLVRRVRRLKTIDTWRL